MVSIEGSGSVAVKDLVERSAEEINKRVLDLDSKRRRAILELGPAKQADL